MPTNNLLTIQHPITRPRMSARSIHVKLRQATLRLGSLTAFASRTRSCLLSLWFSPSPLSSELPHYRSCWWLLASPLLLILGGHADQQQPHHCSGRCSITSTHHHHHGTIPLSSHDYDGVGSGAAVGVGCGGRASMAGGWAGRTKTRCCALGSISSVPDGEG